MTERETTGGSMAGIYETVNFIAVYGTLFFLGMLSVYLVVEAAQHGSYDGIRSFAGVLFPAVIASFVYLFNRPILERLGRIGPLPAFAVAAASGIGVMLVLRFFARGSHVPVGELVVSACFAALVFASRSLPERHALSYYYGVLSGMLLYVILFGFPLI